MSKRIRRLTFVEVDRAIMHYARCFDLDLFVSTQMAGHEVEIGFDDENRFFWDILLPGPKEKPDEKEKSDE